MSTIVSGLLSNAPLPLSDPIAQPKRPEFGKGPDPLEGHITLSWLDWFTALTGSVSASSQRVASYTVTGYNFSIGATDITNGSAPAGVYRFSYYVSVATVSGIPVTATVTLDWTEDGIARQYVGPGLDTTLLTDSESAVILIRSDGASPIRYSTQFGLANGTYNFVATLEQVEV